MTDQYHIGNSFRFGLIVLTIGSIVRIGASIYLPAMVVIGEKLHISHARMSNTLSIYFFVFAFFILVAGALSDAFGRRMVLQGGMLFFIAGSILCALSQSYEMLMAGRAVQAFGASMIPGTLMAMIRDGCSDDRVVFLMGWLAVLGSLFLVISPLIGGVLTHFWGWESNFWFLTLFTTAGFLVAFFGLGETHPPKSRTPLVFRHLLTRIWEITTSADFILVLLPLIGCFVVQGAFLAAAPYVLMEEYGFSPIQFGISNIVIVIGMFSGRSIAARLLKSGAAADVYRAAGLFTPAVAVLFAGMALGYFYGPKIFLTGIGLFAVILGMISPVGMKSSLTTFRSTSGIAAALQGTALMGASAVGSIMVGGMKFLSPNMVMVQVFGLLCAVCCAGISLTALGSRHRLC